MSNSWCKVVNGQVVDGPRAWDNATPPDDTWLPHSLEDQPNDAYDLFVGSHHEVRGNQVVEVKDYRKKTDAEVAEELAQIKRMASNAIVNADEKIAAGENVDAWSAYKAAWSQYVDVTTLDNNRVWPTEPME